MSRLPEHRENADPSDYGLNEAVCPQAWCKAELDVPKGTFDGAEIVCPSCESSCFMTVYLDGDWRLVDPDEDDS